VQKANGYIKYPNPNNFTVKKYNEIT